MRLAKHLGLSAAGAETMLVNGRKLIIVERYDRVIHQDGSVQRLHQEAETPSLPAEIPAIIDDQLAQIKSAFSRTNTT